MSRHNPNARCTPVGEWPELDQALWREALAPADPLEPGSGYAHRWAPATRASIENGYGRWLGWLERSGRLDVAIPPGDRATPDVVRAYLQMLREGGAADNTCAGRLQQLANALKAIHQDREWGWLHRGSSRIQTTAALVRDPIERMRPAGDVMALGRDLIHAALHDRFRTPLDRAVLHRDGLIIALLVHRPFRMANFSAMALDKNLRRHGGTWRIRFEGAETRAAS
jgi:integrase/recombinase XerD